MIKSLGSLAFLGLATLTLSVPATAQAIRFDPAIGESGAAPLVTTVQFTPGQRRLRPGGAGPGLRQGGPGVRPGGGQSGARFGNGTSGPRFGSGGFDHRRRGGGFGIGAGLAAGALLGGAIAAQSAGAYGYPGGYYDGGYPAGDVYAAPPPGSDDDAFADARPAGSDDSAYCAQRFRSYDPGSGTYLGYDGERHPCP